MIIIKVNYMGCLHALTKALINLDGVEQRHGDQRVGCIITLNGK
jgi:hypothetical protein